MNMQMEKNSVEAQRILSAHLAPLGRLLLGLRM